jgi:hypothetical protein
MRCMDRSAALLLNESSLDSSRGLSIFPAPGELEKTGIPDRRCGLCSFSRRTSKRLTYNSYMSAKTRSQAMKSLSFERHWLGCCGDVFHSLKPGTLRLMAPCTLSIRKAAVLSIRIGSAGRRVYSSLSEIVAGTGNSTATRNPSLGNSSASRWRQPTLPCFPLVIRALLSRYISFGRWIASPRAVAIALAAHPCVSPK